MILNVSPQSCVRSVLFCLLLTLAGSTAKAQATQQSSGLDRQLQRLDIGVAASAIINKDSNGTVLINTVPTAVNLHPGNTVGPLVTIRYTVSPYVGFEFNYGYARYTQTFTPLRCYAGRRGPTKRLRIQLWLRRPPQAAVPRRQSLHRWRRRYNCLPPHTRRW